jgi:hypothetical protein
MRHFPMFSAAVSRFRANMLADGTCGAKPARRRGKETHMGFLDNVKSAADQVATRAKEGVDEVQAKRSLQRAYEDLGRTAFELIEENELSHGRLAAQADEVRKYRAQLPPEPTAPPGPEPTAPAGQP